MKKLSEKHCVPCEGGTAPLDSEGSEVFLKQVQEWQLIDNEAIEKIFLFKDFKQAIAFINLVAKIAEEENHHPDISLFGWNKVTLRLSTHAVDGLSDNDFILAAKIDEAIRPQ